MKYDNGEEQTRPRMEEEPWYSDYQNMMELATKQGKKLDVDTVLSLFHADFAHFFRTSYPDHKQALRWAVLVAEITYG